MRMCVKHPAQSWLARGNSKGHAFATVILVAVIHVAPQMLAQSWGLEQSSNQDKAGACFHRFPSGHVGDEKDNQKPAG